MDLLAFLLLNLFACVLPVHSRCARDRSRLVRRVVTKELFSIYYEFGAPLPYSCPISPERDMYADQDLNTINEASSRWVCDYCGKAFLSVQYIDMHFDNRHSDKVKRIEEASCLGDYCDIFRCDVVGATGKPDYWTQALCKEEELKSLAEKCKDFLRLCIPDSLSTSQAQKLKAALEKQLCSPLNCDQYWNNNSSHDRHNGMIPYILGGVLLVFILVIYYVAAYTHFYTNESLFETLDMPSPGRRDHYSYSSAYRTASSNETLRKRKMLQEQDTDSEYDDY